MASADFHVRPFPGERSRVYIFALHLSHYSESLAGPACETEPASPRSVAVRHDWLAEPAPLLKRRLTSWTGLHADRHILDMGYICVLFHFQPLRLDDTFRGRAPDWPYGARSRPRADAARALARKVRTSRSGLVTKGIRGGNLSRQLKSAGYVLACLSSDTLSPQLLPFSFASRPVHAPLAPLPSWHARPRGCQPRLAQLAHRPTGLRSLPVEARPLAALAARRCQRLDLLGAQLVGAGAVGRVVWRSGAVRRRGWKGAAAAAEEGSATSRALDGASILPI